MKSGKGGSGWTQRSPRKRKGRLLNRVNELKMLDDLVEREEASSAPHRPPLTPAQSRPLPLTRTHRLIAAGPLAHCGGTYCRSQKRQRRTGNLYR